MNDNSDQVCAGLQALVQAATAGAIAEAAADDGIKLDPAAVVKHYARQLLEADDATTVHNFDLCSWDAGELLWAMQNWKGHLAAGRPRTTLDRPKRSAAEHLAG